MTVPLVSLKPGAGFPTLRPAGVVIITGIFATAQYVGVDLIISSGSEPMGRHADDPHPRGEAADISIATLSPEQTEDVFFDLRRRLGPQFTVLYEVPTTYSVPTPKLRTVAWFNPNATGPHLHVQLRKGTVYPPPSWSGQRMKALLALMLVAIAAPALAQPTGLVLPSSALVGAQAADIVTTYRALQNGRGVEANPLMRLPTGQQVVMKATVTFGAIYLMRWVETRGHPRVAKATLYILAGAVGSVAIHNERIAR